MNKTKKRAQKRSRKFTFPHPLDIGHKVLNIRAYRERFSVGLMDAKRIVESAMSKAPKSPSWDDTLF